MNHLSFKILIISVLLPPILYIGTLVSLERYLNDRFVTRIESIYIGDTRPLFAGSIRLQDAISQNIRQYLSTSRWHAWGIKTDVTVTPPSGTRIYPAFHTDGTAMFDPPNPGKIASDNYALMNKGLTVDATITIEHNTLLANLLLALYLLISVAILYFYYRRGVRKSLKESLEKQAAIEQLQNRDETLSRRLDFLSQEKAALADDIQAVSDKLKKERQRAGSNEDDYIEEIVTLEKRLEDQRAHQKAQETEIETLRNKLLRHEKTRQKKGKQQTRAANTISKRFGALYKKLHISDRAIDGFMQLTDDMKIKCEETIHLLDQDPKKVPIKRKVFGKKNRETVFEILFAYNGRLYYRPLRDHTLDILTIGTKNTQGKDLAFLEKL
jgi:hypothetical protein